MQVDCASVVFAEVETASLKGRIFWLCYIEIKQHVDTNLITCFTEFRKTRLLLQTEPEMGVFSQSASCKTCRLQGLTTPLVPLQR